MHAVLSKMIDPAHALAVVFTIALIGGFPAADKPSFVNKCRSGAVQADETRAGLRPEMQGIVARGRIKSIPHELPRFERRRVLDFQALPQEQ